MENLARTAGYPDPVRLEWAMEAKAVADLAKATVTISVKDVTLSLALDSDGQPEMTIARGTKALESIPPAVRKHPKIAALNERKTDLKRQRSRMRCSLELAMCRGDAFGGAELRQLFTHPMLVPMLERLVLVGEGIAGYPVKGGKALEDHTGKLEPVKPGEVLRGAHALDLLATGQWHDWQADCFRRERLQPFKQVFRELYVVTATEKTGQPRSQRYTGQQGNPSQALAPRSGDSGSGHSRPAAGVALVQDRFLPCGPRSKERVDGRAVVEQILRTTVVVIEGQPRVDAQQAVERGKHILHGVGLAAGTGALAVGGADHLSRAQAAAGQQRAAAVGPVVAAAFRTDARRPAELAPHEHRHIRIEAPLAQVGQQGGEGVIQRGQELAQRGEVLLVRVPAGRAREAERHHRNAGFDQAAREEKLCVRTVALAHPVGLPTQIERLPGAARAEDVAGTGVEDVRARHDVAAIEIAVEAVESTVQALSILQPFQRDAGA